MCGNGTHQHAQSLAGCNPSYKGFEIYPRVNGVEGLPYHYTIWQQETSVFQSIPYEAIKRIK